MRIYTYAQALQMKENYLQTDVLNISNSLPFDFFLMQGSFFLSLSTELPVSNAILVSSNLIYQIIVRC